MRRNFIFGRPSPAKTWCSAWICACRKWPEEALAGKRGAVVALDPKTGDIIALASTPGFDPNDFVKGLTVSQYAALSNNIDVPLLNRALRGAYPPGSTVKPLYALAAQKYGILTPEQTQFCGGIFILPGNSRPYRDDKKHGYINMRQAISVSCDVYFYRVGRAPRHRQDGFVHDLLRLRGCRPASTSRVRNRD